MQGLELSFNAISPSNCKILLTGLHHYVDLKVLRIDHNCIGDEGAVHLSELFPTMKLVVLNIGFNSISPVGLAAVISSIASVSQPSLEYLTLSGNKISIDVARVLAKYLSQATLLKELFMDQMGIGR